MSSVTVIIPSYNHNSFLKDRLDAITKQTFTHWKAIIIDDNSTDGSIETLTAFVAQNKDKVAHFIVNKQNSGSGYKSWKKGIELAQSEFIWIAETDDYCDATFLETTVNALKNNKHASLAFTASNYVNSNGDFLYNSFNRTARLNVLEGQSKQFKAKVALDQFPLSPLITNGSSVVFRNPKVKLPEALFDYKQITDLFLWTTLLQESSFVYVNKPLNYFRRHDMSTTEINSKKNNGDIYKEYLSYVDYFKLTKTKKIELIDHYVRLFLIPNRKYTGWFYTKPIKKLKGISPIHIQVRVIKGYLKFIFKTICS